jgi:hypothetical protein
MTDLDRQSVLSLISQAQNAGGVRTIVMPDGTPVKLSPANRGSTFVTIKLQAYDQTIAVKKSIENTPKQILAYIEATLADLPSAVERYAIDLLKGES